MQGHQAFAPLAVHSVCAALAMIAILNVIGKTSLVGVWLSFGVFNTVRLVGVLRHHLRAGPLAPREMRRLQAEAAL